MPKDKGEQTPNRETDDATKGAEPLDQRLDRLQAKLDSANAEVATAKAKQDEADGAANRASVAQAFRLSSEFIAGIVVGAGIGYLIDAFFDTSPWGFIVFFLLGFATAILNVLRAAGMVAESQMRLKPAQELHKRTQDGKTEGRAKK